MKKLIKFISLPLYCCSGLMASSDISMGAYIENYQGIAVSEMDRTGIPASITLAQGILESGFGNSQLAIEAKNHFGIKCHEGWEGGAFYKWDDEEEPSCFRVYCSAEESFVDHSEFLISRPWYAPLFLLDKMDYTGWARGLKAAGYATAPDYAERLINLVETNRLARFDRMTSDIPVVVSRETVEEEYPRNSEEEVKPMGTLDEVRKKSPLFPEVYKTGVFIQNNIRMVIAGDHDTPSSIAEAYGLPLKKLLHYNDLEPTDRLFHHQLVFLEPKKPLFLGEMASHQVLEGETMYEIAQAYGIRVKSLYRRNKMKKGEEPAIGEVIYLRGAASFQPILRDQNIKLFPSKPTKAEAPLQKPVQRKIHDVGQGDTLYSIARQYGLSLAALKKLNGLEGDGIQVGQQLKVELKRNP